ncbi:nitrite/sulfite reductase [Geobacter pickeringii]|uniref:Nitrite reductase n=1 Tax=Geobacter pickeringii TaxID=345632 RepID=A0A0B5BJA0_9BACT|nr:nitrite/sulfite reductase [Geobacter pickeringii]AJE04141.1 nitrite reductase [Geobacter pickeringii]
MTFDPQTIRIDGIYEQRQPGNFMLRVKVPAGTVSAEQAARIAEIADRFAGGAVHLTTRGSIELHWLKEEDLAEVWRMLAGVGLTTRGACGGAVRGVTCGPAAAPAFPLISSFAQLLHHHFTRNPHFEGLPKKFKIGVFADRTDGRHLIQDFGLVLADSADAAPCYDVWLAGGLGREPSAGFLFESAVPVERIIPLAEAVVRVYAAHTPKGKRLKHLLRETGRDELVRRVTEARGRDLPCGDTFGPLQFAAASPAGKSHLEAAVFAGELSTDELRDLAGIAREFAGGFMALTGGQNVIFRLADPARRDDAERALAAVGFGGTIREQQVAFRVCPGSHECRMGLAPTRDVALALVAAMGDEGLRRDWSISGCPNSCSQPQLAEVGIVTVKSIKGDDGERHPLFDLYRRGDADRLGTPALQGLTLDDLTAEIRRIG